MAGWGSGFLAFGLYCLRYRILGMRRVLFAGRVVTVLVVTVYAVTALVGTVLVMTVLVARPGAGC